MVTTSSIGSGKKVNVGQSFANGMSALQTVEKEKFILVDETGAKKDAERLSLFKLKDNQKIYIVYTLNEIDENDMIKLYVAILNDVDGVYSLQNIEEDAEWTTVKDAMRKIAKDGQQILNGNQA